MIKLLGIPFDKNSTFMRGPALAPPKLRQMDTDGSANRYSESGDEIIPGLNYLDLGDMSFNDCDPETAYRIIKDRVTNEILDGTQLISIGGDHSISFPVIEAHAKKYPKLHVLHLDAHADLYEDFEGNPYSHASPFARLVERNLLGSLTQVGIRTLNTHQREQANKFDVKIIEMKDHNLEFLEQLKGPLYISLDLDVLDPAFAPGISHHEPGGMSPRQLLDIIQALDVEVIGADIVELNPNRDINNATAMVAYKMFKEIAVKMIKT